MIAAVRFLSASGAGDSFLRLSIAFSAMPLFGPSLAARSNSTVWTPALVRCAAICAPMTPAPSTAALRMRNGVAVMVFSGDAGFGREKRGGGNSAARHGIGGGGPQARRGKAHQVSRGLAAVDLLGHFIL